MLANKSKICRSLDKVDFATVSVSFPYEVWVDMSNALYVMMKLIGRRIILELIISSDDVISFEKYVNRHSKNIQPVYYDLS
jgi:hypothetical protein